MYSGIYKSNKFAYNNLLNSVNQIGKGDKVNDNKNSHLVLCGTSLSGKTSLCKLLENDGYVSFIQEEYASNYFPGFIASVDNEYGALTKSTLKLYDKMVDDASKHKKTVFDTVTNNISKVLGPRMMINGTRTIVINVYRSLEGLVDNLNKRRIAKNPIGLIVFEQFANRYELVDKITESDDLIVNRRNFIQKLRSGMKYEFESEFELDDFAKRIFEKMNINDDLSHTVKLKNTYYSDETFIMDKYSTVESAHKALKKLIKNLESDSNKLIFNRITIGDEVGRGKFATVNDVTVDGFIDKQIIIKQNKSSEISNRVSDVEIKFYDWISNLPNKDKIFFVEMYGHRLLKCNKDNECFEVLLEKKGKPLNKLMHEMSRKQKISVLCQVLYAINLMHQNGFYHNDTKTDNICIDKTFSETVRLGEFGYIETHGYIASLIDYGNVTTSNPASNQTQRKITEVAIDHNTDLKLVIDYIILDNESLFKQINKDRNRLNVKEILDILKIVPKNILNKITGRLNINEFIGEIFSNEDSYDKIKSDLNLRAILYDIMQMIQVTEEAIFIDIIKEYFKKDVTLPERLLDEKIIMRILSESNDMNRIIENLVKLRV